VLAEQHMRFETAIKPDKWKHGVTFLSTNPEIKHEDFVTQARADYPIKDILRRLDEFRR
jgi:hypothetical protein